ncbi:MAG TPA: PAS domain S-box protein, partial [Chitinophagaceae bacterium]|nr:PAS domain S-box protein [Chitinophagaceae bacterium]
DENDKITYVNKCWTDFTGIRFSELSDNDWNILIHPADLPAVFEQFDQAGAAKPALSMVYRLQYKTGEYRWVLANAVPRFSDGGGFLGYMGSVVDIHDRKLAEEKIAFQASLIENVSDIIISTDMDFTVLTWNRTAEKIYGIPAGQAVGHSMLELLSYVYINSSEEAVVKEIQEKGGWKGDVIFRNGQGNLVYLQSTVSGLAGENNNRPGYVFVNRDITEKVKAEESIKISEAFYRSLIGNSLNGIALTDTEGNINFIAPSVKNILGYEPEELIGANIFTLVHPDDVPIARQGFINRVRNEPEKEYIVIRVSQRTGKWLWCTIHGHNLLTNPYVQSMVIYFSDDTQRKGIEEALSRKEKEFRNLAENAPTIITRLDRDARFIYYNRALARLIKTPSKIIIGKTPGEAGLEGEALQKIMQAIGKVFTHKTTETLTIEIPRRDGSKLIFLNTIAPELNEAGEVESILSISSDITEMKYAEAALIQSERRLVESESKFKSLFQSSLDIVNVLDDQYRVTFITPSIKVVMGYEEEEVIGRNGLEFIHPEDAQRVKKALDELVKTPGQNVIIDTRILNKKGEWVWMEGKVINKLNDPIINGIIVSFHDISDRKQSEQQLQGYSEHITNILSSITDGFIALDFNFNVLWWNPIAAQLTGIKDVDVLGKNLWEALPALKKTKALAEYRKAVANKTVVNFEIYLDALKVYFDINAYPSQQGLFVYFKDITGRKTQEMLLTLEKEVLELNANPAASLQDTVDYFLKGIESLNPGMTCSVQLLEEGDKNVRHLSGPNLSPDFIQYINGMKIGPGSDSCGMAMFLQKTVIVPDILTDPHWASCKCIYEQFNIMASWSFPIITASNSVLGSFTAYYKRVQSPTDLQLELLSRATTLLGIIIENKQAEQKINISNERYLLATKA